jgi:hypothetical protein
MLKQEEDNDAEESDESDDLEDMAANMGKTKSKFGNDKKRPRVKIGYEEEEEDELEYEYEDEQGRGAKKEMIKVASTSSFGEAARKR